MLLHAADQGTEFNLGIACRHDQPMLQVKVLNLGKLLLVLAYLLSALSDFFGLHDASHTPSLN
jgi:hypothetical protein